MPSARLSDNVALRDASNAFTGDQSISGRLGLLTTDTSRAPFVVNGEVPLNTAILGSVTPIAFSQAWPVLHFNSYYSGGGGINRIFTGGGGALNYAGQISLEPGAGHMRFYTTRAARPTIRTSPTSSV